MHTLIMSDKYRCFINELKNRGYTIIPTDDIKVFLQPEQKHADMQILKLNKYFFLLNECSNLNKLLKIYNPVICSKKAGKIYPDNILLNFLYLNGRLYGKLSAIAPEINKYCVEHNIEMENVNQGYCRCSTLVVSENAVITSDSSIEKVLKKNGVEVLKISPGNIALDGFDYGFIGGAGARIDNKIIFLGNIKKHPDYDIISDYIKKNNLEIEIICEDMQLTDIGGIITAK